MMSPRYKLSAPDMEKLIEAGLVSPEDAKSIKAASLKRQPEKHANKEEEVKILFKPTGGAIIRSILFYGGEHFNKPYHFVAEVVVHIDHHRFCKWLAEVNCEWLGKKLPFYY